MSAGYLKIVLLDFLFIRIALCCKRKGSYREGRRRWS